MVVALPTKRPLMRLWDSPVDRRRVLMCGEGDLTCCGVSEHKKAPAVKPGTLLCRHCDWFRLGDWLGGFGVRLLGLPRLDHAGDEALHQLGRGPERAARIRAGVAVGGDGDHVEDDAFGRIAGRDGDGWGCDVVVCIGRVHVFLFVSGSSPFSSEEDGGRGRPMGGIYGGHHEGPRAKAVPRKGRNDRNTD